MSAPARKSEVRATGAIGQSVELAFRFLFLAVCAIAVAWSVSNFHQVPPDSQALVLRFGTIVRQQGPGLLLAWPKPIEQVFILPSAARQIEFRIQRFDGNAAFQDASGDSSQSYAGFDVDPDPRNNTGFLLTGDSSVVHLQATVFYQIVDPAAYMISSQHIAPALERLFIASAVSVCAARDLDSILVARPEIAAGSNDAGRRERLRSDIQNAVNRRIEALALQGAGLGIQVSRVDLAAAIPTGAKAAFDKVLTVTQNADTDIAVARTGAQMTSQTADREKDRIATDATANAEEQVTGAKEQTASIAALASQAQGPSRTMLLNRVYFERVGNVLGKVGSVEAVDPAGKVHLILPGDSK